MGDLGFDLKGLGFEKESLGFRLRSRVATGEFGFPTAELGKSGAG